MEPLQIQNPLSGNPILYRASTTSTMDDAATLLADPSFEREYGHGTTVIAGTQTRGKGRTRDRNWISPPGVNLLCTTIIDTHLLGSTPSITPLVVGLAVAEHLREEENLESHLKWPNDILVHAKKMCGILCEMRGRWIAAGIGLNLGQNFFPEDLRCPGCSVYTETGRSPDPVSTFISIASLLEKRMQSISEAGESGVGEIITAIEAILYGNGCGVRVQSPALDDSRELVGTICGIGSDGQLLLRDENERVVDCYSGEVTFLAE